MGDTRSEIEIIKEFIKKYSENQKGWMYQVGISRKGHPTWRITSPEFKFIIKRDSLYSGRLGIEDTWEDDIVFEPKQPTYGFRPITEDMIKDLMLMAELGAPISKAMKYISWRMKKIVPNIPEKKSPLGFLQGPIIRDIHLTEYISPEQADLDRKLETEIEKLRYRTVGHLYT